MRLTEYRITFDVEVEAVIAGMAMSGAASVFFYEMGKRKEEIFMKLLKQLAVIFGVCLVGEAAAAALPFSFPASVISMFLLLALLLLKIIKMEQIKEVSEFLIQNMAFFFIPAGVAIMEKYDLVKGKIAVLLLICVITLVLTFLAAAFTVKGVIWLQERRRKK